MADQPVLVVTRLDDPTSDIVIAELNARSVPVVRLDPGDFMTGDAQLTARYGPGGLTGTVTTCSRELDLASVRSVYLRRPSEYTVPAGMDEQDAVFALAQARHGFGGVLGSLSCRYVNHPWKVMRAEFSGGRRLHCDLGLHVCAAQRLC